MKFYICYLEGGTIKVFIVSLRTMPKLTVFINSNKYRFSFFTHITKGQSPYSCLGEVPHFSWYVQIPLWFTLKRLPLQTVSNDPPISKTHHSIFNICMSPICIFVSINMSTVLSVFAYFFDKFS